MIDLHSHILAGIDDGARSISESIELAKQSVDSGVTSMVCTPHIHFGKYDNSIESINEAFEQFVDACSKETVALNLSYSCEVRICIEITSLIKSRKLPFLGYVDGKSALLLELPHSHIPVGTETLIKWLIENDIQPVIPHPERNREIMDNYSKLNWLKSFGCIFQITAGSITGSFRDKAQKLAWYMLEQKLAAYVASDLHSINKRPNEMGIARKQVESHFGSRYATEIFYDIPKSITHSTEWRKV